MTTAIEHDDRPSAGASGGLPADARSRRSMLALAAVESRRLLRHPAVLAATALSGWLLWRWGRGTAPVLHYADIATQLALAPLAGAALLATNLAVLRSHRDGAVDLYGATRLSLARRTLAHLLSVLPLVALGGILVVADLAWLAGMPGSAGTPHAAEAATGPALIALGGCLGVLLGRLWRSVALAPLALVALAVGSLIILELNVGGHDQRPWTWLGTLLRPVTIDPPPAALLGRPATWHLVYLLGITVVLAALAVWRSQAQARLRRRAQVAAAIVLVAGLAATAGAAVAQTRATSPALAARRLAAQTNPAAELVCQRRGPAVYCVFPGFEPQISLWEPTVRAVVAAVPPAAAAPALPVTVAQRVGWSRLIAEESVGYTAEEDPARGRPPVAPVGTAWGRDGPEHLLAQARLAANVAARLTGLTRPEPPPGNDLASWNAPCRAHGVVALWLAGQASPHAAEGLRQGIADVYGGIFTLVHDVDSDDLGWSERAGRFALALLDRPRDQVAQALWRNWDLVTSPETTLERLGEVLGVPPPPPGSPNPSDSGAPAC
jgi:hypothetical protein